MIPLIISSSEEFTCKEIKRMIDTIFKLTYYSTRKRRGKYCYTTFQIGNWESAYFRPKEEAEAAMLVSRGHLIGERY